ncbi:MAG: YmdB family metallophosphoesterase [Clostridia bacterium]|nr:YmdB family metallophosphoesterase [Clostridia bacterium]
MLLNILFVGDVVGTPGVEYLKKGRLLSETKKALGAHLTVVNGENSADGNGMTVASAEALLFAGADVVTGGNHTARRADVLTFLDDSDRVLRPANLPGNFPGAGYTVVTAEGVRVLVAGLLGQTYMDPVNSPYETLSRILERERGEYDIAAVDFHAEATSEKYALARLFDGKVSVIAGTHTHVQTADCSVLPGGTGYITDLGMTGSHSGILGVKSERVIDRLVKRLPARFEGSVGGEAAHGALFSVDVESGRCASARSIVF